MYDFVVKELVNRAYIVSKVSILVVGGLGSSRMSLNKVCVCYAGRQGVSQ